MDKTILITGSTDGIGKLAAIQFAKDGHSVYIHRRNQEKRDRTVSEIKTISNNSKTVGFLANFSNLEQVKEMVNIGLLLIKE